MLPLDSKGFSVYRSFISSDFCDQVVQEIDDQIDKMASELNCDRNDFLSVVNRWSSEYLLSKKTYHAFLAYISKELNKVVECQESAVIYKSSCSSRGTVCHQDVSYAFDKPYDFSTWISLSDISVSEGVMQFLPYSQLKKITTAVDFWQPDFVDDMKLSDEWIKHHISINTKKGDALFFDSRLWHGSGDNISGKERWAIVFRWKSKSKSNITDIPKPDVVDFGMWNCGEKTKSILQNKYKMISGGYIDSYVSLLDSWVVLLQNDHYVIPDVNKALAIDALNELRILEIASVRYGGGDSHGRIYAKLWRHLLRFII
ncbi:MAG: phytanoyl-CoA dioxygenase family protein [Gammaproteobacteria bacterium]